MVISILFMLTNFSSLLIIIHAFLVILITPCKVFSATSNPIKQKQWNPSYSHYISPSNTKYRILNKHNDDSFFIMVIHTLHAFCQSRGLVPTPKLIFYLSKIYFLCMYRQGCYISLKIANLAKIFGLYVWLYFLMHISDVGFQSLNTHKYLIN